MMKINRREFLKAIGLGSTTTATACSADPVSWDPMVPIEHAYPYVAQPEEIEPGNASYITSVVTSVQKVVVSWQRIAKVVFSM